MKLTLKKKKMRLGIKKFDQVTTCALTIETIKKCVEFVLQIRLQTLTIHFFLKRLALYFFRSILQNLRKCYDSLL